MVHKEGKYPVNARVDVDYTNGKPKIKFGYTTNDVKKQSLKQNKGLLFMIIFLIIFMGIWMMFNFITIEKNYPKECDVLFNQTIKGIENLNLTCDIGNYTLTYENREGVYGGFIKKGFYLNKNSKGELKEVLFKLIMFLAVPLLFSLLINRIIIKTNWYKGWNPKFQAKSRRKKYYKFKPIDVENNLVEIPSFNNVELIYKTKGDFSKYLTHIKIREHKWNPYEREKGKWMIKKSKKWIIKKLKRDDYTWYARFYFSQKPMNGFLEVIYQ